MENNEKKKLTKGQMIGVILAGITLVGYIVLAILDIFEVVQNIDWAVHLCGGVVWLIFGVLSLGKNKWQPILNFLLAAGFTALAIIEMVELFA